MLKLFSRSDSTKTSMVCPHILYTYMYTLHDVTLMKVCYAHNGIAMFSFTQEGGL